MYRIKPTKPSKLRINKSSVGESIEAKVKRFTTNKEPIKDNAPLAFSERKDGVKPDHNIRTDRWEHAVQAMDTVAKTNRAARENKGKVIKMESDGKTESVEGTTKPDNNATNPAK